MGFLKWQREHAAVSIREQATLVFWIIASIAVGSIFCYFGFWYVAIAPVLAWIIPNVLGGLAEHKIYRSQGLHIIRCGYPDCLNPVVSGFQAPGGGKVYHRCQQHLDWFDDIQADLAPTEQPYRGSPFVQVQS